MRTKWSTLWCCAAVLMATAGCRQDMHDQPRYEPLERSTFFADTSASRVPVPNTVARGHLRDDALLHSGMEGDAPAMAFPFPVDRAVMDRGRDMFDAYCSPCHGLTGAGDGMVVLRGFTRPPSLMEPRLLDSPPGHYFNVITNGFGAMPDHAAQVQVNDRWAIVAYIRALQLAGSARIEDVPPSERGRLEAR